MFMLPSSASRRDAGGARRGPARDRRAAARLAAAAHRPDGPPGCATWSSPPISPTGKSQGKTGFITCAISRWTRDGGWQRPLNAPRARGHHAAARAGRRLKLRKLAGQLEGDRRTLYASWKRRRASI